MWTTADSAKAAYLARGKVVFVPCGQPGARAGRQSVGQPVPVTLPAGQELLTTYVMPPALTAELYRALGNIPGVTIDHHAVDVAGRSGAGFQVTLPRAAGGGIDQLVIDPETFGLLGQQLISGPAAGAAVGHVLSGTAIISSAPVSGPGALP